ncbi:MAG TPA: phosphoribosylanthranilate isomerase [Granulicella sp.]
MWVKICANTNLEDAQQVAALGADAVGFVFAASKRQVTAEQVAPITPHLPANVERVGVFPAWTAEEILAATKTAGLTTAQLHTGLNPDLLHALHDGGLRLIQTLHWMLDDPDAGTHIRRQLDTLAANAPFVDRVLIDSKLGAASGGTGVSFDWTAARELFHERPHGLRLILAGGLRPESVAAAIELLHPWGVDVASGVEQTPGKKDLNKIASFIKEARSLLLHP